MDKETKLGTYNEGKRDKVVVDKETKLGIYNEGKRDKVVVDKETKKNLAMQLCMVNWKV